MLRILCLLVPALLLSADPWIASWTVLGPFPSEPLPRPSAEGVDRDGYGRDFLAAVGGERAAQLAVGQVVAGPDGKPRSAGAATASATGLVRVAAFDRAVGYALAEFRLDQDREVALHLGSDGSPQVWVDGNRVIAGWRPFHRQMPWEYGCRLRLAGGPHRLLVKLDNRRGWWGFTLALHDLADEAAAAEALHRRLLEKPRPGSTPVGFTVRSVAADGDGIDLVFDPRPLVFSAAVPLAVGVGGATWAGVTGAPLRIPATAGPLLTIDVTTPPGIDPPRCEQLLIPVQAPGRWAADLAARLAAVRLPAPWAEDYRDHLAWAADRLAKPVPAQDQRGLADLDLIETTLRRLAAGGNPLAEDRGRAWPCRLERTVGTTPVAIDYALELPAGYGPGAHLPVVIDLHGAGYLEETMHAGFVANKRSVVSDQPGDAEQSAGMVRVDPSSGGKRWDPAILDALLDRLLQLDRLDADRVYLMGHSMGGHGTWEWAATSPMRFAAIAPLCGQGQLDALARLAGLPVWATTGADDQTVPPLTVLLSAAAVPGARVSVVAAGHSLPAFDLTGLYAWFSTKRRDPAWRPAAPAPPGASGLHQARVAVDAPLADLGSVLSKPLFELGRGLTSLPTGAWVALDLVPGANPPRLAGLVLGAAEPFPGSHPVPDNAWQSRTLELAPDRPAEALTAARAGQPANLVAERLVLIQGLRFASRPTFTVWYQTCPGEPPGR
ncbi:hypothetical protein LBMAG53_25760 [Planctomycetota bacterium]|nr:hypothetical protein LBMAG53_25760 [Planctomycetota bacterium]